MKKYLLGAVVLIALFALLGCPTDDSSSSDDKWTIKYNASGWLGGGIPQSKTIAKGSQIGTANLPQLTNTATQVFNGWATSPTGAVINSTYVVDSNITLYVRWQPVIEEGQPVLITYNANGWTGESIPVGISGTSGSAIGAAAIPTLTSTASQIFKGWATTSTGTVIDATHILHSNTTLFVIWEAVVVTITVTAEGDKTAIEQGQTLQLSAVVTGSADQSVTWSVMPTGQGVTISETGLITATAEAVVGSYSANALHDSDEIGSFGFTVEYALSGAAIDGGKDAIALARWTKTDGSTIIWRMSEYIAALVEAETTGKYDAADYTRDTSDPDPSKHQGNGNFQEPALPFLQAGNPVINIVNGGINITDRVKTNYDSVDIRLTGTGQVPGVILTDYEYLITFIGVALSDSPVSQTPTFGMNGQPYNNDGGQMGERIGVIDEGSNPVFKGTLTTLFNHVWNGFRLELGSTQGQTPDFRVVDVIIEETRQFLKCECTGCALNGKSINEAKTEGAKCTIAICTKSCTHSCNVCKTIGPEFEYPIENTSVAYVVPAEGTGYFFLDLNATTEQYDVTNNGNPGGIARPIIVSSANSVTYTYTNVANQQLWFKLTSDQYNKINSATSIKVHVSGSARDPVAEATSASTFRACLAAQAGSNWNGTGWLGGAAGPFSYVTTETILTKGGNFTANTQYLVIQQQTQAITDVTINAIQVMINDVDYVAPAGTDSKIYLNLNETKTQYDVTNSGNPGGIARPLISTKADKITVTYTQNNQQLWITLTEDQIAAIKGAGGALKVKVNGSTTSTVNFRGCFAIKAGGGWNASGWIGGAADQPFATIAAEAAVTGISSTSNFGYLMIQHRAAANSIVTIESIEVTIK